MKETDLKRSIVSSLRKQGFVVSDGRIRTGTPIDKNRARKLHSQAVGHRIQSGRKSLGRHETQLLKRLAFGKEIAPNLIAPRLVEVKPRSENELLFRSCNGKI